MKSDLNYLFYQIHWNPIKTHPNLKLKKIFTATSLIINGTLLYGSKWKFNTRLKSGDYKNKRTTDGEEF